MALPDARHINTACKGPLGHLGHMRARISEAQVKVLIAGPAVSLVGRLIGVGRDLPQAQGLFDTKALRLHGWAPIRHACEGVLEASA